MSISPVKLMGWLTQKVGIKVREWWINKNPWKNNHPLGKICSTHKGCLSIPQCFFLEPPQDKVIHFLANFWSINLWIYSSIFGKQAESSRSWRWFLFPSRKTKMTMGNHQFSIGATSTHSWLGFLLSSHLSFQGVAQVSRIQWIP